MKALVKKESSPGLWLEDVPEPTFGINGVVIKVKRTAICGTDMHIYNWDAWAQKTIPVPMVVGHEFVGEIVEVGSNVIDFKPGQLVSGEGHVVCGRCRNCMAGRRHLCARTSGVGVNRPGAFAEYLVLPMSNVWEHRPNVDLDVAARFDPLGNAVHTALQYDLLGEDVLITGRTGEEQIKLLVERYQATTATLRLAEDQYFGGLTDYLSVLTAQKNHFEVQAQLLSARRQLISDRISLMKALGGDWMQEDINNLVQENGEKK